MNNDMIKIKIVGDNKCILTHNENRFKYQIGEIFASKKINNYSIYKKIGNISEKTLSYLLKIDYLDFKKILINKFNGKYNRNKKVVILNYDNAVKAKEYFESLLIMDKLKKDF